MSTDYALITCPVCFKERDFVYEDEGSPDITHLFTTDAAFNGPGKDRTVRDSYLYRGEKEGAPAFWVHLFPICAQCCGTGVVVQEEDFFQLQREVREMHTNLNTIMARFQEDPRMLREHAERLTRVLIPFIVRRALSLVKRPAQHSYARYLSNLFGV